MSILISAHNISKNYSSLPLFSGITFALHEKDKVGIIGQNGSGKSTFMKILSQEIIPDEGSVSLRKGVSLAYIPQQSIFQDKITIEEILQQSLKGHEHDPIMAQVKINKILGRFGFPDSNILAAELSGGWKKRLSIACALIREPDLVLFDEPTNHLDLEGILWLEGLLKGASFAFVVISHDRYFLQNVTEKTVELSKVYPEGIFSADCPYFDFLNLKSEFLAGQTQQQENLANKVRREVEWLRQGVKARTTKQKARIDEAVRLQAELGNLKSRLAQGTVDIEFDASQRKTKKLISLSHVSKSFGDKTVIKDFSFTLLNGIRLGLLGLNASGKTTFLKLLADQLSPDKGQIERADGLKVIYFSQHREALNPQTTLRRTLAPDSDSVVAQGRSIHVVSWAKKFLLRSEQLDTPVGKLSGGEQARVQIARLMTEPCDVLLLDEPTNDLDIQTLEVLEESLLEFQGAIVLVTHDRYMLDRISTLILAFDGLGNIEDFADCAQWQAHRKEEQKLIKQKKEQQEPSSSQVQKPQQKRLSYLEKREFEQMEIKIAQQEELLSKAQEESENPVIMADIKRMQACFETIKNAQEELDRLYERWAELENKT